MLHPVRERSPQGNVLTFIEMDDLEGEPVPKRLGLCANPIGAFEYCLKPVFDNDLNMEELPMKNHQRQFICGYCVDRLLSPKPTIQEPEKVKSHKHGRTGARLPTGEDL